jgi:hypothetical protein
MNVLAAVNMNLSQPVNLRSMISTKRNHCIHQAVRSDIQKILFKIPKTNTQMS